MLRLSVQTTLLVSVLCPQRGGTLAEGGHGTDVAAWGEDVPDVENGCPVHVPIPFSGFINKVKPREKKVIVTDSLTANGYPDGTVITRKNGRQVYVSKEMLRMIDEDPKINGNLTGSAVTMNLVLRRLTEYVRYPEKFPVHEAVRGEASTPRQRRSSRGKPEASRLSNPPISCSSTTASR